MLTRVGLLRHYPVSRHYLKPGRINSSEFAAVLEEYDELPIQPGTLRLDPAEWPACIASDLPRAAETARLVYPGPIEYTPDLREIPLAAPFNSRLRMPLIAWDLAARYAWRKGHISQPESQAHTWERAHRALELAEAQAQARAASAVLVVAHGGILWHVRKLLLRRGFRGPRFAVPENARLYVYERLYSPTST
jgi:broad specificity phosphatase PhoE